MFKKSDSLDDFFRSRIVVDENTTKKRPNLSHLAPSKELHQKALENSKRVKCRAYSKNEGNFWWSYYQPEENRFETGIKLQIMEFEYQFANHAAYNNQYVYMKNTKTLFYIANEQAEDVQLTDLNRFQKELNELMNDEDDDYFEKHLTYAEIEKIITLNGGHSPHSIPSSLCPKI